jgi:NAD-dependent SIR2 family protein deacetylase
MMVIVGCSLKVSPAAEMVEELREEASLVVIDPAEPPFPIKHTYAHLKLSASKGMKIMEETLLEQTKPE